jgi:hypothetical protein
VSGPAARTNRLSVSATAAASSGDGVLRSLMLPWITTTSGLPDTAGTIRSSNGTLPDPPRT